MLPLVFRALLKAIIEIFNLIRMNTTIKITPLSSSDILALGGGEGKIPGVTGIFYDLQR